MLCWDKGWMLCNCSNSFGMCFIDAQALCWNQASTTYGSYLAHDSTNHNHVKWKTIRAITGKNHSSKSIAANTEQVKRYGMMKIWTWSAQYLALGYQSVPWINSPCLQLHSWGTWGHPVIQNPTFFRKPALSVLHIINSSQQASPFQLPINIFGKLGIPYYKQFLECIKYI